MEGPVGQWGSDLLVGDMKMLENTERNGNSSMQNHNKASMKISKQ